MKKRKRRKIEDKRRQNIEKKKKEKKKREKGSRENVEKEGKIVLNVVVLTSSRIYFTSGMCTDF